MNFPQKIETERLLLSWPQNPTFDLAKTVYAVVEKSRNHLSQFLKWAETMNSPEQEFVYLKNYAEARFIEEQGFYRIVIKNDVRNIQSANVAKNAGYHLDGIMRQDRFNEKTGTFRDTNIWSKLKFEEKND